MEWVSALTRRMPVVASRKSKAAAIERLAAFMKRTARSRSSGGYLLDEPPAMTPSFPRRGVFGPTGAVHISILCFVVHAADALLHNVSRYYGSMCAGE